MDVSTSSIPAMKLNDTAFGFIEISNSTIDTLTVQGCAPNGHVGAIKAYQTTLTTVPDFSGSVFPVHMFPTECEGKWEESQDKLTLYKKVWYIPGISVKLPFCSKLLALGTSRRIPVIARLRVPAGTPRHLGTSSGKVRVAEATVDGFFKLEEKTHALVKFKPKFGSFRSDHDPDFKYRNGKRVRPRKRFDMTCLSDMDRARSGERFMVAIVNEVENATSISAMCRVDMFVYDPKGTGSRACINTSTTIHFDEIVEFLDCDKAATYINKAYKDLEGLMQTMCTVLGGSTENTLD